MARDRRLIRFLGAGLLCLVVTAGRAADLVELRSGAKVSGEILSRTEKDVTIRYKVGTFTYTRKYPLNLVQAITKDGKREVVGSPDANAAASGSTAASGTRSREEVLALIDRVGRTPPEWFDETPLEYPESLDLSWPAKPEGPWNNQKN